MEPSREEIVFEVIKERRSIRSYKDRDVSKEKLTKILEAGQWAPTPSNIQSWRFIVVQEAKRLETLKVLSPGFPKEAHTAIAICSDQRDVPDIGGQLRLTDIAEEAAVAMQNMLLMAHSLGLGSCPVGSFSEAGIRELLELPDHIYPVFLVALGYPDKYPMPPQRKEFSQIVSWEIYKERVYE